MNGYICFYKGKKIEVRSSTSYGAQCAAAILLKAKHTYDVAVVLAEKDDKYVVYTSID